MAIPFKWPHLLNLRSSPEPGEIGAEDTEAALAAQLGIRVLDDDDAEVDRQLRDLAGRVGVEETGVIVSSGSHDYGDGRSNHGVVEDDRSRDGSSIITTSGAGRISLAAAMSRNHHSPGSVLSHLVGSGGAIMTASSSARLGSNSPGVTVVSNLSAAEVGVGVNSLPSLTSLAVQSSSMMLASPSTTSDAVSEPPHPEDGIVGDDEIGLFDSISETPVVAKENQDELSSTSSASPPPPPPMVSASDVANAESLVGGAIFAATSSESRSTASSTITTTATPNHQTTSLSSTVTLTGDEVGHSVVNSTSMQSSSGASIFNAQPPPPPSSQQQQTPHQPCFECPFCKCSLASAQALNSHIETHINRTAATTTSATSTTISSSSASSTSSSATDDKDEGPRPKKAKVISRL